MLKKIKNIFALTGLMMSMGLSIQAFANTNLTATCDPDPTGSNPDCNSTTDWQHLKASTGRTFHLYCPNNYDGDYKNFQGASYRRDKSAVTCWPQNGTTWLWECQNWSATGKHKVNFTIHCTK